METEDFNRSLNHLITTCNLDIKDILYALECSKLSLLLNSGAVTLDNNIGYIPQKRGIEK